MGKTSVSYILKVYIECLEEEKRKNFTYKHPIRTTLQQVKLAPWSEKPLNVVNRRWQQKWKPIEIFIRTRNKENWPEVILLQASFLLYKSQSHLLAVVELFD